MISYFGSSSSPSWAASSPCAAATALLVASALLAAVPCACGKWLDPDVWTPKATLVDNEPSEAYASLSVPEGTLWCQNRPTFWMVGHQFGNNDHPYCQNEDGTWTADSTITTLDFEDAKSPLSGWRIIDRHGCTLVDANLDGIDDIVCVNGANFHTSLDYPELYLTMPDGTLQKEIDNGLQKYPSMAYRWIEKLKGPNNTDLLMTTTSGLTRGDGLPNQHRMFRVLQEGEDFDIDNSTGNELKYFKEVPGPWIDYFFVGAPPLIGDFNGDGLDDFFLMGWQAKTHMYIQQADGSWIEEPLPNLPWTRDWQNGRFASVTNSASPDLIITTGGYVGIQRHYIWVLTSIPDPPYFEWKFPYMAERLAHMAYDVEVLDVNKDGYKDLYVVQYVGTGCAKNDNVVPTVDRARDILFVGGQDSSGKVKWDKVVMENELRGCGGFVKRFGDDAKAVLANGNHEHSGYHYLLEWNMTA